jgi:hypothetical protein
MITQLYLYVLGLNGLQISKTSRYSLHLGVIFFSVRLAESDSFFNIKLSVKFIWILFYVILYCALITVYDFQ